MAKAKKQFTSVQEPPVKDSGRAPKADPMAKERSTERNNGGGDDPNAQPTERDRVYGVASRDRWAGGADISELHRESRQIEGADVGGEEEEEEEEEASASDLTVAELKAALDEAEVEYDKNAKKADLVALYEEHGLGDAE
jgi:hypothetical protein